VPSSGSDPQHLFGNAVRERRLARGLSQEKLAQLAGIHRNYAGEVERGERNVALVNMVRVARALGVSLSVLVEGIDQAPDIRVPNRPKAHRARRRKA
jgi:transcriptional regulator with XRE-family HTH domain